MCMLEKWAKLLLSKNGYNRCSSILAILIDKRDILIEKKIQKDEKK